MKKTRFKSVAGILAPAVRPTPLGAALLAAVISVPIGAVLFLAELFL
ncbi:MULTISPECIES: hypothetical protein [Roseobacter]|nr:MULTISPECIES: hypothetical protein [Roseobacter]